VEIAKIIPRTLVWAHGRESHKAEHKEKKEAARRDNEKDPSLVGSLHVLISEGRVRATEMKAIEQERSRMQSGLNRAGKKEMQCEAQRLLPTREAADCDLPCSEDLAARKRPLPVKLLSNSVILSEGRRSASREVRSSDPRSQKGADGPETLRTRLRSSKGYPYLGTVLLTDSASSKSRERERASLRKRLHLVVGKPSAQLESI